MITVQQGEALARWLDFLGIGTCTCPYEWKSRGSLYRVPTGKGWVRMATTPGCPHHPGSRV